MRIRSSDEDYTAAEAEADVAQEKWDEVIDGFLQPLIAVEYKKRTKDFSEKDWEALDEDALDEELQEQFLEEAEEAAQNSIPCCNQFSCPCGNDNNVPD